MTLGPPKKKTERNMQSKRDRILLSVETAWRIEGFIVLFSVLLRYLNIFVTTNSGEIFLKDRAWESSKTILVSLFRNSKYKTWAEEKILSAFY